MIRGRVQTITKLNWTGDDSAGGDCLLAALSEEVDRKSNHKQDQNAREDSQFSNRRSRPQLVLLDPNTPNLCIHGRLLVVVGRHMAFLD